MDESRLTPAGFDRDMREHGDKPLSAIEQDIGLSPEDIPELPTESIEGLFHKKPYHMMVLMTEVEPAEQDRIMDGFSSDFFHRLTLAVFGVTPDQIESMTPAERAFLADTPWGDRRTLQ